MKIILVPEPTDAAGSLELRRGAIVAALGPDIEVSVLTQAVQQSEPRMHAINALIGERNYQDGGQGNAAGPRDPHSLGAILVFIDTYFRKTKDAFSGPWLDGIPPMDALHGLRKVGALCLYGLEAHGAPTREMEMAERAKQAEHQKA